jgi:hypothetical protein
MLARAGLAIAMIAVTGGASAQDEDARFRPPGGQAPYATIYRDTNYSGPAVAVERANPDLRLGFSVRSIRVHRGAWQLCSLRNYGGTCITVIASTPDLGNRLGMLRRLGSMRPVASPPVPPVPPGGGGQSLRGMGAEFFPAPRNRNGSRVLSCRNGGSTANCAARTADEFCRSAGWNGSAHETQQTEARRVYLADVLCVRSGF